VEIHDAVGDENMVTFGMNAPEVLKLRVSGYNPQTYYRNNPKLRAVVDFISNGIGGVSFASLASLFINTDYYMAFADFEDYCNAQEKATHLYNDKDRWNKMSLINIAKSGVFSADRAIEQYAKNIWNAKPIK